MSFASQFQSLESRLFLCATVTPTLAPTTPTTQTAIHETVRKIATHASPTSIDGLKFIVTVKTGRGHLAKTGSYAIRFSKTGGTYRLAGRSGVLSSHGTFTYAKTTAIAGKISINDSVGGPLKIIVKFTAAKTGTVHTEGFAGSQTGTFQQVA